MELAVSNVLTVQEESRSAFNLRAIAEKVVRLGGTYVLVGALISSVEAGISQPGMIAWTVVLGVFGGLIGFLGGRVSDVLLAAVGTAALFASSGPLAADLTTPDAIARGLLLGSVAGGLFRPWCRLSTGCFSVIGYALKSLAGQGQRNQGDQ